MSKAIHFRNKAIRAEKYFRKSDDCLAGKDLEPEVQIKLEDYKFDELEKIKSEPLDEDPNYELLQNIDTMIGNNDNHLESLPFVDVFSSKSNRDFFEHDRTETRKKARHSELENFGSSSGIVRCKLCMKSFTSVSSHQNHMKTVHREMSESEMHKCKFCNRYFKLKIYLNRHVARIHGTKKCGRSSKRKCHDSIFNKEDVSLYCEVSQ